MQGNFAAIADGDGGAGEGLVRDGALDDLKCGLELGFAADVHGLERHGIFRQLETETQFHVDAGNGYGQMSANGNLAEERTSEGNLRDIADAECGEPGLRLWETLDQIGAAEAQRDDRLAGFEELVGERCLLCGNVDIAFAVADAYEKREQGDVVSVGRRQLEHVGFDEFCVGAQRGERIKARAQFAL